MQLKIRGKRILYTICFFLFCLIDQRIKTASGLDGRIEMFRNLVGVVMAVILMSAYRWNDFKEYKIPYAVWTVCGVIGAGIALWWGANNRPFMNEWVVAVLDVVLFGYILIHTFISVVIEKKFPKLNKKLGVLWLVMMILMMVSRSDYIWPLCYFIMFGCFYLTEFTTEEQTDLFQGILNGIILAFFAFQAYCCMFRPYDVVRYKGIYNNPNLNTTFYLEVLAAVFAKILYVTREEKAKFWKVLYWLGAGVLYAFLFMAISRTGWAVCFVMGLLFLFFLKVMQGKKNFLKNGLILILCFCLTFPICFGFIRYLPPAFHHPVWFWGEWSENRVHSWDPWNSPKYVDADELLNAALGRVTQLTKGGVNTETEDEKAELAAEQNNESEAREQELPDAYLTVQQAKTDPVLVRKTIYMHYLKRLNLMGHPQDEQGLQLTPVQWTGHAHNIYLQYGTDFGILMLLSFVALIIYSFMRFCKIFSSEKTEESFGYLLFFLVPLLFGTLEFAWGSASLMMVLFFLSLRKVVVE